MKKKLEMLAFLSGVVVLVNVIYLTFLVSNNFYGAAEQGKYIRHVLKYGDLGPLIGATTVEAAEASEITGGYGDGLYTHRSWAICASPELLTLFAVTGWFIIPLVALWWGLRWGVNYLRPRVPWLRHRQPTAI